MFQAQTPSVLCLADEISSECSWKEITDTTIRILPERTGTQQYARLCQYKDEAKAADFTENYDLSNDIGIPSTTTSHEPLILNEMQDQNYRQVVQTLKQKEKRILLPYFASHKNIS